MEEKGSHLTVLRRRLNQAILKMLFLNSRTRQRIQSTQTGHPFSIFPRRETMRQVSLTIKTSPAIKEILKEIAWEELRTLSGQVEMILVKWLGS